jgi:xanthine dehydrogenase accessory factor
VAIVMDQLREAGHDHDRIDRIHSPIGIRIGAVTPAEIAISILAEIISVRRTDKAAQDLSSCDLEIVEELAKQGDEMSALITIFDTTGSVPIECGAKLAMSYEGRILGTIGGGCSEADAMQAAREAIRKGIWLTHTVDMTDSAEEDGMVCGGEMHVVIELLT